MTDTSRSTREGGHGPSPRPAGWAAALLLTGGVLLTAACSAGDFRPAATAEVDSEGATATDRRVEVTVEADVWSGTPASFDDHVPILIHVENRSDRPLEIRYNQFALASRDSGNRRPVDPRAIEGVETESVRYGGRRESYLSHFDYRGFRYAPHFSGFAGLLGASRSGRLGVGAGLGHSGFGHGRFGHGGFGHRRFGHGGHGHSAYSYGRRSYGSYRRIELPTRDMLLKAVPEGRLAPGGSMTGYLYFPTFPDRVRRVAFETAMRNPSTDTVVSAVSIPLVRGG